MTSSSARGATWGPPAELALQQLSELQLGGVAQHAHVIQAVPRVPQQLGVPDLRAALICMPHSLPLQRDRPLPG